MKVVQERLFCFGNVIETDRQVPYRKMKTSLGVFAKQKHKILHADLPVKNLYERGILHKLTKARKRLVSIGARKCSIYWAFGHTRSIYHPNILYYSFISFENNVNSEFQRLPKRSECKFLGYRLLSGENAWASGSIVCHRELIVK